jgi:hypothetical protein
MSTSTRVFLVAGSALVLLVGSAFGIVAATVYRAGMIEIEVQEKGSSGSNISLKIPGVIVPAAARLLPNEALQQAGHEIEGWLPAIRAAVDELATCEDVVFVHVLGREEVTIAKRDGSIIIHVESDEERVRISVPLHTLSPALASLERGRRRV